MTSKIVPSGSMAHRLSVMGLLVTLGIVYGDIGTSPLYVMRAIIGAT
ncbi:MAG: KUP/HAK/KT family potassium transporter, partial [Prevotella sp.]|nr:KUP/HAK/KT family potassium transporter [Prevotella sp.]